MAACLLFLILFHSFLLLGAKLCSNFVFAAAGQSLGWYLPEYEILGSQTERILGLFLFLLTLGAILFLGIRLMVRWENQTAKTILLFFLLLVQGGLGKKNRWMLGMTGIWLMILLLSLPKKTDEVKGGSVLKRALFRKGTVLGIVFFLCGGILYVWGNEHTAEQTMILRDKLSGKVDELRYGKTYLWEGEMGGGKEISREEQTGEKEQPAALKVTMSTPQSMYLRGYIGSRFEQGRWRQQDKEILYDAAKSFFWLHREGFYAQNQLALAAVQCKTASSKMKNEIFVESMEEGRKYVFLPYEFLGTQESWLQEQRLTDESMKGKPFISTIMTQQVRHEEESMKDKSFISTIMTQQVRHEEESMIFSGWRGGKSYQMEVIKNQVVHYPQTLEQLLREKKTKEATEYLRWESYYNTYVYQTDLKLSGEEQRILKNHLEKWGMSGNKTEDNAGQNEIGIEEAKEKILMYLGTEIHYDEEERVSDPTDFLREFLEQKGRGGEQAYATAAVLMLRYFGIPARYVEGYLITPEDAEQMEEVSQKPENVKVRESSKASKDSKVQGDLNAESSVGYEWEIPIGRRHAWAEYYQDGVGFLPFEVCPPYLNVMESASGLSLESGESQTTESNEIKEEEKLETSKEEAEERKEVGQFLYLLVWGVGILFFLILIIFCIQVRKRKKAWRDKLNESNANLWVQNYCEYMLAVFFAFYQKKENVSLYCYAKDIEWLEAKEQQMTFQTMLSVYQKARFSHHICSEQEQKQIKEYCGWMGKQMYDGLKLLQKWKYHLEYGFPGGGVLSFRAGKFDK